MCILTYTYMLAMTDHPLQHAPSISVGVLALFFITDSTRHHHNCILFCDLEGSKCTCSYTVTYSMSTCTNVHISNMTHHPLQQAPSISVGDCYFIYYPLHQAPSQMYMVRELEESRCTCTHTLTYYSVCIWTYMYVSNDTSPTTSVGVLALYHSVGVLAPCFFYYRLHHTPP